jgi:hypothetical protein
MGKMITSIKITAHLKMNVFKFLQQSIFNPNNSNFNITLFQFTILTHSILPSLIL